MTQRAALAELHPFLKPAEKERLCELEREIQQGLATFIVVGNALMEIRESRLYKEQHRTFEAYCRERWGFEDSRARQLISAAKTVTAVTESGLPAPANEAQTRELVPLRDEPEQLQEVWKEVHELHPEPTAANVREVVQRKMGVHYSSDTPEWSTPQDLYDALNAEFGFELDVCATDENAKAPSWFTEKEDGLTQPWTGTCWMNPPYGDEIGKWVAKAYESAQEGATVVCLVPGRIDTAWFWDYCRYGEVRIIRGRLRFGGGTTGAPFPSVVVVFPRVPKVTWWER